MTIKQEQEPFLEKEEYPWILGNLKIIFMKMENQDVLTVTYIDTYQKNA